MLETMMLVEEMPMVAAATMVLVLGVAALVAAVVFTTFSVVMSAAPRRCRGGRDDWRCDQDHGRADDRAQAKHEFLQSGIVLKSLAPLPEVRSRQPIGKPCRPRLISRARGVHDFVLRRVGITEIPTLLVVMPDLESQNDFEFFPTRQACRQTPSMSAIWSTTSAQRSRGTPSTSASSS